MAETPQVVQVLKLDALGRVELVQGPEGPRVRRVACGGSLPGSALVARLLLQRERRALEALEGLPGIGGLVQDGSRSGDVLLRRWIEGTPLYLATELPRDFFDRLEDLVRAVHARGVCHNDLHKEPNVLVGADGRPHLIDFQLASVHPRRGRTFRTRTWEDLRHVEKHRRRYAAQGDPGPVWGRRRSPLARLWMAFGKPLYNRVTRGILGIEDGEPRRPREGPWPAWGPPLQALPTADESPPKQSPPKESPPKESR